MSTASPFQNSTCVAERQARAPDVAHQTTSVFLHLSRRVKIGGVCVRVSERKSKRESAEMSSEEAEHVSASSGLFRVVAHRDQSKPVHQE